MASTSGRLLDWQFQCSVCLEVFTDPVSTPCGHTFCRACLSGCWDGKDEQQCPLCMKRFRDPLDLSVNVVLAQITQDYKRRRLDPLEPCAESPKKPTCDICTGGNNNKVVKTCRSCHTSLCADHVETHPAEHKLVHLMDHFEQKLCEKHDRLLELFCSTDQACICTLCAEGDHVTHSTVPIEREWTLRQAQLKSAVLEVKQDILDRQKKVQDIKQRVELSRRDSKKKQEEGLQVLATLLSYVEKCRAEFEEVIKERQRAAESRAESLVEELEQEIAELKKRNTALKQLLSSQDRAHILQSFPSQHTPFISKDWAKVMVHIDPCLGTGGRVFAPLEQDIRKKLRELTGAEFEKIQQNADDVTLDPDTANDYLQVSNDEKQVHFSNYRNFHFDSQRRFAKSIFVLGKETFSSGRHYWEVQVKGKTNWWLGVVLESIDRKVDVTITPENGVWMLRLTEGKILNGLTHPVVQLSPISVLETVGVYVDYEEGRVSFYDAEAKSHLFSFTGSTFTEGLYPMFSPGVKKTDKDPLIISPVTKPG